MNPSGTLHTTSPHVVCIHCGRVNRVAAERAPDQAQCGVCHGKLFEHRPVEVDESGFDIHIARNDIAVLVDVWAPWCGPCRQMAPMFEKAASILEPRMRLLKLNADEAPRISEVYGIRSIPTLLLFQSGKLIASASGAMSMQQIINWARDHLNNAPR